MAEMEATTDVIKGVHWRLMTLSLSNCCPLWTCVCIVNLMSMCLRMASLYESLNLHHYAKV